MCMISVHVCGGGGTPTCAWALTKGGCLMSWFIYYSSLYSFETGSLSEQGARLVASKVQWSSFLALGCRCTSVAVSELRSSCTASTESFLQIPTSKSWDLSRVSIILSVLLFIFNGLIVIIYIYIYKILCDNLVYICNVYNDQVRVISISIPSNTSHFFMLKIFSLF